MRRISLIYARSANHCIGAGGGLPWNLPDDMAFFEETTRDTAIIMGRRTYEDHGVEIPGRTNIVITSHHQDNFAPGMLVARHFEQALDMASQAGLSSFVIGGADLFRQAFSRAGQVYETIVDAEVEGDAFVDAFDFSDWDTQVCQEHPVDRQHSYAFTILRHTRQDAMVSPSPGRAG